MKHSHLSERERYQIEAFLGGGLTVGQAAARLGRHRATIYRERKRTGARPYRTQAAQSHRQTRALSSNRNAPRHDQRPWRHVRRKLMAQWSPQQIAQRARLQGKPSASHQAIYNWIGRRWPKVHDRPRWLLRRAPGKGPQRPAGAVFGWAKSEPAALPV